jgi:hypothetical protein
LMCSTAERRLPRFSTRSFPIWPNTLQGGHVLSRQLRATPGKYWVWFEYRLRAAGPVVGTGQVELTVAAH